MHVRLLSLALFTATLLGCTHATPTTRPATMPTAALAAVLPTKTLPEVARSAREDIAWLADDAREGRGLGTRGLDQTAEFIAARYRKLGLLPLPSLGGFFQTFDYGTGNKLGPGTRLAVDGWPLPPDAFASFTNSAPGPVTGEVAFVGYAIGSEQRDYDDFAGVDLKGRVALAMRWEPHNEKGKSRWAEEGSYSSDAAISRKAEQAAKAGATALLLVNAPTHHDDAERLLDAAGGLRRRSAIPVFHITVETANAMLSAAGAPDLSSLQHSIDTTAEPASRILSGVDVSGQVEVLTTAVKARNVVALLPGAGPNADEYVVIGAHYDHVGRGAYGSRGTTGQIHNGADDNASGTTVVLQLAEEFALAGRQQRSILFVNFTLEEVGLIGSENFMKRLPVPSGKIAAMLNLDMVGRMRNDFLYVGGGGTAAAFESILSVAASRSPVEIKSIGKGGKGPSDHRPFAQATIPVLFFYTGMHGDYHSPSDDADKINYDGLGKITWLAFDAVRGMCAMPRQRYVDTYDDLEPNVKVRPGETPARRGTAIVSRSRVTLGIQPDYSAESSPGVHVAAVSPDSAAAAAGLQPKDVITRMNDREIGDLYDLNGFLGDASPGDVVKITVTRGGSPVTVDVTLRARAAP